MEHNIIISPCLLIPHTPLTASPAVRTNGFHALIKPRDPCFFCAQLVARTVPVAPLCVAEPLPAGEQLEISPHPAETMVALLELLTT